MKSSKMLLGLILVTIVSCTSYQETRHTWIKNGVEDRQVLIDDGECNEFVDKIVVVDRGSGASKVRHSPLHSIDPIPDRLAHKKNRKLVKDWCMENRGYEKQSANSQDDR